MMSMNEMIQTKPLARKPGEVLEYIRGYVRENRVAPSVREIRADCHISTTSLVDYYLGQLEREGYIRRDQRWDKRRIARGIVVIGASLEEPGNRPNGDGGIDGPTIDPRLLKIVLQLERIFPVGRQPECDICGQQPKAYGDRFCRRCRQWLIWFAGTTSPRRAGEDMARCLAVMVRYGQRPPAEAAHTTPPSSLTASGSNELAKRAAQAQSAGPVDAPERPADAEPHAGAVHQNTLPPREDPSWTNR
jgi:hypothetical protein